MPEALKTLAHSDEGERAVLACVILRPELIREIADALRQQHFYRERHQIIWGAMTHIWVDSGETGIDLRTLQARLQETGELDKVGGLAYLAGLDEDLPDLAGWERYLRIVQGCYARRRLAVGVSAIVADSHDSGVGLDVSLGRLAALQVELEEAIGSTGGDLRHVVEAIESPELDWNRSPRTLVGLPTGFPDLDNVTLGAAPGALWIVAGRPGMGKTSIGLQIARAFTVAGKRVAFISLEMSEEQLARRMVSQAAAVPLWALRTFKLSDRWRAAAWAASAEIGRLPLWVDDTAQLSPAEICSRIRRQASAEGVDAVILDYIGKVRLRGAGSSSETSRALGDVSSSLTALAKDLQVPVIALHQVNREPAKAGSAPKLEQLAESDKLAHDADLVALLHRPAYYDDTGSGGIEEAEFHIAKHREGATGIVKMLWDPRTMRYLSKDHHDGEAYQ